ncbi:MAG: hypothetical protein GTO14_12285 [Anaerolineales bacterium]|nr:hypothetical protein [Anaerolineales bacterium]
MRRTYILHPFLFATYPVAALLAHNIVWATVGDALRSGVSALVFTAILLLFFRWIANDWIKAGVISSLAVLLFFSYGHIYETLKKSDLFAAIGRHRFMIPVWIVLFLLGALWILRSRHKFQILTNALNVVSIAALVIPVLTIVRYQIHSYSGQAAAQAVQAQPSEQLQAPPEGEAPDVYYIILDAYGRADVIERIFTYDNTSFLEGLEEMGFYVADYSLANYAQTGLSITSSTNMNYLQDLLPNLDSRDTSREVLWSLIQSSKIRTALEGIGYKTVAFPTGLAGTDLQNADVYFSAGLMDEIVSLSAVTPFESMLIYNSAGRVLTDGLIVLPSFITDLKYPFEVRRARTLNAFDRLMEIPALEGPHFVFAHIIAPHPPFVFDRDGNPVDPNQPFSLGFGYGDYRPEELESWIEGYREQLIFVNKRMTEVLSTILAESEIPPIIIIQADHGPKAETKILPYTHERLAILNAYYLPSGGDALLYPEITPVNSFRVVFNYYFGGSYELLPDRIFYSQYSRPYHYFEVTDEEIDYY